MKKRFTSALMAGFAIAVAASLLTGANAYAKKGGGGGGGGFGFPPCPYWDILCLMVWDPVVCEDGNVYSNSCVALQHCQFDCEPSGGPLW